MNLTENWRENLLAIIDELVALTGSTRTKIGKDYAGSGNFYQDIQRGKDVLTDRNLIIHEKLLRDVKKERRAKK
jgi:hypothetical protein